MSLLRRHQTLVVRVGTGPAHLARGAHGGYRIACGRTISEDRATVMSRVVWLAPRDDRRSWRHCERCDARAQAARTDADLFA